MDNPSFTTVRTAKTAIEADLLNGMLSGAGLHPVELSMSSHFSVAGVDISFAVQVPTTEAAAAKDLLDSYESSNNAA